MSKENKKNKERLFNSENMKEDLYQFEMGNELGAQIEQEKNQLQQEKRRHDNCCLERKQNNQQEKQNKNKQ